MALKINIARLMRPSGIALLAVTLSFCAWLCPDFGELRKGFTVAEHPGFFSSLIVFSWYLLIFTGLALGQRLGAGFAGGRIRQPNLPPLDSPFIYGTFTVLGAIGTIDTFIRIFQALPLFQALLYIYLGQANRLKVTLYEGYSAGIPSLRYLVLYSASLSIYRFVKRKRISFLGILNLLLLGATVFISSRLILIATLLLSAFLIGYGKQTIRISLLKLGVFTALIFVVLSVLNSSRNKNFYSSRNQSFAQAGLSEIITYLGSPFHVSLGAASRIDDIVAGPADLYREYIDVEEALTTNSAFVQLHEQMGYLAWPYIGIVCCLMGFMFTWLTSFGKTALLLPSGAILYGAAELWRIDLFQQGIFIVWFVVGIALPATLLLFGKRRLPRQARTRRVRILGSTDLPEPQT